MTLNIGKGVFITSIILVYIVGMFLTFGYTYNHHLVKVNNWNVACISDGLGNDPAACKLKWKYPSGGEYMVPTLLWPVYWLGKYSIEFTKDWVK